MAQFTVKQKKMDDVVRETDVFVIGSRSSCSFSLDDPLVAEEHCIIMAAPDGFVIEDRDTSIGTFVNGKATVARTPLPDGAEVVIGVTRMIAKVDVAAKTLLLDVKGRFYYDDKKDALEWSKKEVAFGRFRPVSVGNWIATFSTILLVPICFIPFIQEPLVEPGQTWHAGLHATHAALFDARAKDIDIHDCDACHDSFAGTPASKCMACHEVDIARGHHPAVAVDSWGESCVYCHVDHRGTGEAALIARQAPTTCGQCHADDVKPAAGRRHPAPMETLHFAYNTFAHADHDGVEVDGRKLDCHDCHKQSATPDVPVAGRARDFTPVDYQACLACHGSDAPEKRAFQSSWHGAVADGGAQCKQCHNDVYQADLGTVAVFDHMARFDVVSRSHHPDMGAIPTSDRNACARCHRDETQLNGGNDRKGVGFEHGTHIVALAPKDDAHAALLSGDAASPKLGQCSYCHSGVARSTTLGAAAPNLYTQQSCNECHSGDSLRVSAGNLPTQTTKRRADFPHDRHLGVSGGCYACHSFPEPAGDAMAGLPTTPADVKSCVKCHSNHENVGGNHCQQCHQAGDPSYWSPTATDKHVAVVRHPDPEFNHWSLGHREWTDGNRCVECHGKETWAAKTLAEIAIPAEDAAQCRACHVGQKKQFHWR